MGIAVEHDLPVWSSRVNVQERDWFAINGWSLDGNDPFNQTPLCGLQPYTVTQTPRLVGLTFSKNF